MSRNAGFPTADTDVTLYDDGKVKALWRLLRDEDAMSRAMVVYEATRLASWLKGQRVCGMDAAPIWMQRVDEAVKSLQEVDLLDGDGCIPEGAWSVWFGKAATARAKLQEKWNRANKRRKEKANSGVTADVKPADNGGQPAVPPPPDRTGPDRRENQRSLARSPARGAKEGD